MAKSPIRVSVVGRLARRCCIVVPPIANAGWRVGSPTPVGVAMMTAAGPRLLRNLAKAYPPTSGCT
eukprot:4245346-Pyramimonas_sp.AAC.2